MSTPEFFNVQPAAATLKTLFEHLQSAPRRANVVTMATINALGRVLAEAPRSPVDLPSVTRSTMDGFAVRAADTFGASQSLPAYLKRSGAVKMGEVPTFTVEANTAAEIHTGAMLPAGADAVVMVEQTQPLGEDQIEVLAPVAPGENLVQIGEDVAKGAPILPAGHRVRPQDIGGMLAVGILEVMVAALPRVAVLSSGDELVPPEQTPAQGQIRDINTYTLAALMQQTGAQVNILGIAEDKLDVLLGMARAGLAGADMLVMTAGSSVSTRDLTRTVISRLGEPGILQHGLAVKPGKPTLIAVCDGKPVIGLPGNPVSAFSVARQIVLPTLRHLMGEQEGFPATVQAVLSANIPSTTGREDSVPVRLSRRDDGSLEAEPVFGKSNLIYTLVNAGGLIHVPLNSNGLKRGAVVDVQLL